MQPVTLWGEVFPPPPEHMTVQGSNCLMFWELHSKGENSPRMQCDLCPLEFENSAPGKCQQRAWGLSKALLELIWTAPWKAHSPS